MLMNAQQTKTSATTMQSAQTTQGVLLALATVDTKETVLIVQVSFQKEIEYQIVFLILSSSFDW